MLTDLSRLDVRVFKRDLERAGSLHAPRRFKQVIPKPADLLRARDPEKRDGLLEYAASLYILLNLERRARLLVVVVRVYPLDDNAIRTVVTRLLPPCEAVLRHEIVRSERLVHAPRLLDVLRSCRERGSTHGSSPSSPASGPQRALNVDDVVQREARLAVDRMIAAGRRRREAVEVYQDR